MKKIAIAVLFSAFVATPALADNTGKFYVGGSLGSASFSNANITINSTPNTFPNPLALGLTAGYHFTKNWAMEVGYTSFGKSTLTSTSGDVILKTSSLNLAAVGTLPLSPEFDLFGKLGMSSNSGTVETTGSLAFASGGTSRTSSQSSVLFGLGAQYHVNSQLSVRAQYEDFGNFDNNSAPLKATTFSLGVTYDF